MSAKTKKKVKPQKLYAIVYRTPKGKLYALYSDYGSIGFHERVVNTFNKSGATLQQYFHRGLKLAHAKSRAECGESDVLLSSSIRKGKVFILRLNSKNCPLKIENMPARYDAVTGVSLNRVSCYFDT
jgi:hypothetical protein